MTVIAAEEKNGEAQEYHDEFHDLITALSTEFINLDVREIDGSISNALARIGTFASADRSYVFQLAPGGDRMSNTHEWTRADIVPQIANLQDVAVDAYAWCMSHILRGATLHIPDIAALPDEQPDKRLLMEEGIRSLLAVPITCRGAVLGFLGFDACRSRRDWQDGTIALLKITGSIIGNILDRKRIENALRREADFISTIIDTAGSFVLVLDPTGRCVKANCAFVELTGVTASDLNEVTWRHVVPAADHAMVRTALGKVLNEEATRVQFESRLSDRAGDQRVIIWTATVIRTAEGTVEFVVITGSDLTETRLLQEQVEQARRLDSLGRVAAVIAHEFNNVLMAIQPHAELICRLCNQPHTVKGAAERIGHAVKRGTAITQQVTRFAKPAKPTLQELAVLPWMEELVEEIRPVVARRSHVPIAIEIISAATDARVAADPLQLQQVFSNLVLNAVDSIPHGGRITIGIDRVLNHELLVDRASSNADSWVHIRVSDTGAGIPPAVLERIFEPLFTTKKRGTGLGLAVVNQIIKMHGGLLSVETAVGQGSTFHVFLRSTSP